MRFALIISMMFLCSSLSCSRQEPEVPIKNSITSSDETVTTGSYHYRSKGAFNFYTHFNVTKNVTEMYVDSTYHHKSKGVLKKVTTGFYKEREIFKIVTLFNDGKISSTFQYIDSCQYGSRCYYEINSHNTELDSGHLAQESFFYNSSSTGYEKNYYNNGYLKSEMYRVEGVDILSIRYYEPQLIPWDSIPDAYELEIMNYKKYQCEGVTYNSDYFYENHIKGKSTGIVALDGLFEPKRVPFYKNVRKGNVQEIIIRRGATLDTFSFPQCDTIVKESYSKESMVYKNSFHSRSKPATESFESVDNNGSEIGFKKRYTSDGVISLLDVDNGETIGYRLTFGTDGIIKEVEKSKVYDNFGNGKTVTVDKYGNRSSTYYRGGSRLPDYIRRFVTVVLLSYAPFLLYLLLMFVYKKRRKKTLKCPNCGAIEKLSMRRYFKSIINISSCESCKTPYVCTVSKKVVVCMVIFIYPLLYLIYYIFSNIDIINKYPPLNFPEISLYLLLLIILYVLVAKSFKSTFGKLERKE